MPVPNSDLLGRAFRKERCRHLFIIDRYAARLETALPFDSNSAEVSGICGKQKILCMSGLAEKG